MMKHESLIGFGDRSSIDLPSLRSCLFVSLLVAFCPISRADDPPPHRAELLELLAYHRLQTVGSSLAYKTYSAYVTEFDRLGKTELKRIASGFRDLAKCELDGEIGKREVILTAIDDAVQLAKDKHADKSQASWTINYKNSTSGGDPSVPVLTIKTPGAGDVEIEYQFFDASQFRSQTDKRIKELVKRVMERDDLDAKLMLLWTQIFRRDWESANRTNQAISAIVKEQKLSEDQKQEWQYLLSVVAEGTGQADSVSSFLNQRLETSPTSLWAMRALSLMPDRAPESLAVLQASMQKMSSGHHPFAREVLTRSAERTERVLDQYWTVAWSHTQVESQQNGWALSHPPNPPAVKARALVGELTSPTVMETWRAASLLRIATIIHSGVLVGDSESWQLMINDDVASEHPLLRCLKRMSRDLSGLQRTGGKTDTEMKVLEEVQPGELMAMLWGDDASRASSVSAASSALSGTDDANTPSRKWWAVVGFVLGIIVAVIVFLKRQRVSAR